MADQDTMPQTEPAPPVIPDPQGLQSNRLSNKHKRWMFFGVMGVVLLIILANLVGTNQTTTTKPKNHVGTPQQQQNPTPAQIRDWENNLKQQEAQLLDETSRHAQQLARDRAAQGEVQPMTADDLQRAAALQEAAQARAQFQQTYGVSGGRQGKQPLRNRSCRRKKSSRHISHFLPTTLCGRRPSALQRHRPHRQRRTLRRRRQTLPVPQIPECSGMP